MEAIVQIDEQGCVKLPPRILDALHLVAPGQLRAQASAGKLELTPVHKSSSVTFIEENGLLVAANTVEFDALSAVHAVREDRL